MSYGAMRHRLRNSTKNRNLRGIPEKLKIGAQFGDDILKRRVAVYRVDGNAPAKRMGAHAVKEGGIFFFDGRKNMVGAVENIENGVLKIEGRGFDKSQFVHDDGRAGWNILEISRCDGVHDFRKNVRGVMGFYHNRMKSFRMERRK